MSTCFNNKKVNLKKKRISTVQFGYKRQRGPEQSNFSGSQGLLIQPVRPLTQYIQTLKPDCLGLNSDLPLTGQVTLGKLCNFFVNFVS